MTDSYVVIDTETSGLFDYSKPADAEGQPRMASLAIVPLDAELKPLVSLEYLIRPEGWEMNEEAAKIHGLTQERLMETGITVDHALREYNGLLNDGHIIVGYNASFDLKVLRGELRRAGMPDRFAETRHIDCMRPLTNICKIPKASGKGYKWPKLTEAYKSIFGRDMEGAHGALADALACAEIFRELFPQGIFKAYEMVKGEAI